MTLQEFLKNKNMTMYRLSKDSGISYTTIHDLFTGKTAIGACSSRTLSCLSAALHCSMEDLMKFDSSEANKTTSYVNFFTKGAIDSRGNARHWFRYLRKMIKDEKFILSSDDINKLLNSDDLSFFQKITLERVSSIGSPTFNFALTLNKPARLKYYNALRSVVHD